MMNRLYVLVALGTCVFLTATIAGAQTNSTIAGTVKDATGAVLPGVTVEASSPALIERTRTVVTDGSGQYRLIELRPGTYTVTFTLQGFSSAKREGISLTSNFTATVNADMRVGDVSETITVTGESPVVDLQNVTQQRVATREVIDTVPTGKSFANIGILIPGTAVSGGPGPTRDVGGTAGNANQTLAIHGGRTGDMVNLVDGMSIGMLVASNSISFMVFPDGNVEEISIELGSHSAEMETGGIRVNVIPKSGGNNFAGTTSFSYGNGKIQSANLTDSLRQRGLQAANKLDYLSDISPSIGGPIVRDRLWFYGGYRNWRTVLKSTSFPDTDPKDWVYTPDLSKKPVPQDQITWNVTGRLTWQATEKNKFAANLGYDRRCDCHSFIGGTITPDASLILYFPSKLVQGTWTAPMTNKLLFEAGASAYLALYDSRPQPTSVGPPAIELNGGFTFRSRSSPGPLNAAYQLNKRHNYMYRGSASYVTGAHAAKIGFNWNPGSATSSTEALGSYIVGLLSGVPNRAEYLPYPQESIDYMNKLSFFAQDQWSVKRLTLTGGLRFDWLRTRYGDVDIAPTSLLPARQFPGADVLNWKDLSPRFGASFDLFGNGRTALKASLSRYVAAEATDLTRAVNPANAAGGTLIRAWTDFNGDFVPQGDPLNPLPNDELIGPSTNTSFGKPVLTLRYDPAWTRGFGDRAYNWEVTTSIQHELVPRMSVNAGYFRRMYGGFSLIDNLGVAPGDNDPFCITAPRDTRLPGGGGQQICDLYDVNPAKVGAVDRLQTKASNYGDQTESWQGIDLTLDARLPNSLLFQGGFSTGKTVTDNCEVTGRIDSPTVRFCHVGTPFLTQFKFLTSYQLLGRFNVAATFQSVPGPQVAANYVAVNALVAPSLGRNLSTGANGTVMVNLVEPGTMFGDRMNQLDLRVARTFTLGRVSLKGMLDLYNAMNANPVLAFNNSYGTNGSTWLVPQQILQGRLLKFSAQINY